MSGVLLGMGLGTLIGGAAGAAGPVNSALPTLMGSTALGSTLTAGAGAWTAGAVITRQMTRNNTPISGATGFTYVVAVADQGQDIRSVESATLSGITATAASAPISIPAAAVTMPAITASPATYTLGAASGTTVSTLSAPYAGATRVVTSATANQFALSVNNLTAIAGVSPPTTTAATSLTVTDTLAGATNSPLVLVVAVTVTAAAAALPAIPDEGWATIQITGAAGAFAPLMTLTTDAVATPVNRVTTQAIAFRRGDVPLASHLEWRATTGGAVLPLQLDVLSRHTDDSAFVAQLSIAAPSLAINTLTPGTIAIAVSANPAATLTASAFTGRAGVLTITPGTGVAGPVTFAWDFMAAVQAVVATSGDAVWRNGPIAREITVETLVPVTACGSPAMRAMADVSVNVDGVVRAVLTLANDADQLAATVARYTATATLDGRAVLSLGLNGETIYTRHHPFRHVSRAVSSTAATAGIDAVQASVKVDTTYLADVGVLPRYDQGPGIAASVLSNQAVFRASADYALPMHERNHQRDMGAAGDANNIGWLPLWDAAAIVDGRPDAVRWATENLEAAQTIPYHIWNRTLGRWVNSVDQPDYWSLPTNSPPNPQPSPLLIPGGFQSVDPAQAGWSVKVSHMPSNGYGVFWLTGQRRAWREVMAQAAFASVGEWPATRFPGAPYNGQIATYESQNRAVAWSRRNIDRGAILGRDGTTEQTHIRTVCDTNYKYHRDTIAVRTAEWGELAGYPCGDTRLSSFVWGLDAVIGTNAQMANLGHNNAKAVLRDYYANFAINRFFQANVGVELSTATRKINTFRLSDDGPRYTTWRAWGAANKVSTALTERQRIVFDEEGFYRQYMLVNLAALSDCTALGAELQGRAQIAYDQIYGRRQSVDFIEKVTMQGDPRASIMPRGRTRETGALDIFCTHAPVNLSAGGTMTASGTLIGFGAAPTLEYSTDGQATWITVAAGAAVTATTWALTTGALPLGWYRTFVRVKTNVNLLCASMPFGALALPSEMPAPTLTTAAPTSLAINAPIPTDNSFVEQTFYRFRTAGQAVNVGWSAFIEFAAPSLAISGLTASTSYEVDVRASNVVGMGPARATALTASTVAGMAAPSLILNSMPSTTMVEFWGTLKASSTATLSVQAFRPGGGGNSNSAVGTGTVADIGFTNGSLDAGALGTFANGVQVFAETFYGQFASKHLGNTTNNGRPALTDALGAPLTLTGGTAGRATLRFPGGGVGLGNEAFATLGAVDYGFIAGLAAGPTIVNEGLIVNTSNTGGQNWFDDTTGLGLTMQSTGALKAWQGFVVTELAGVIAANTPGVASILHTTAVGRQAGWNSALSAAPGGATSAISTPKFLKVGYNVAGFPNNGWVGDLSALFAHALTNATDRAAMIAWMRTEFGI